MPDAMLPGNRVPDAAAYSSSSSTAFLSNTINEQWRSDVEDSKVRAPSLWPYLVVRWPGRRSPVGPAAPVLLPPIQMLPEAAAHGEKPAGCCATP